MKKIVITFIAVLIGVAGAQAQNTINKTTPEGHRTFETEYIRCTPEINPYGLIMTQNDRTKIDQCLSVSLICEQSDESQSWFLGIRMTGVSLSYSSFPKGGRMLIKLNDGGIIELTQSLDNAYARKSQNPDNILYKTYGCNQIDGQYSITEDNIRKITSQTVTKVRIEIKNWKENYVYYIDFDKNNISEAVTSEYGVVSKTVKMGDDYIYSGF